MHTKKMRSLIAVTSALFITTAGLGSLAMAQTPPPPPHERSPMPHEAHTPPQPPHAQGQAPAPGHTPPPPPPHERGHAQGQAGPHISWAELTQKLESQGYAIRELDQKPYGWKAEVIDSNRYKLDLRIDRQGNIVSSKYD